MLNIFFFHIQYIKVAPDQGEVMKGLFVPWCENCDSDSVLQVGIKYYE